MIEFTYKEVLDATKHQDDKIGRLITAVSFLTAAALALAGLASAGLLSRNFDVPPYTVPLAVIALGLFLVGVIFTVVLLVAALATPLRLPGLARSSTSLPVNWASEKAPASPLYFAEIAGLSLSEWNEKWHAPDPALQVERFEALIGETHNLAARTNFKYDRSTEAIATFSLALVSLAAAIVLVFTAATQHSGTVHLGAFSRAALGLVFSTYCLIQMLARLRYQRQTMDEAVGLRERGASSRRAWMERLFAVTTATSILLIILPLKVACTAAWIWPIALLGAAAIGCYWGATSGADPTPVAGEDKERSQKVKRRRLRSVALVGIMVGLVTALACVGVARGNYMYQLVAAYAAVVALIAPSFLQPSMATASRRRRYLKRQA